MRRSETVGCKANRSSQFHAAGFTTGALDPLVVFFAFDIPRKTLCAD